MKKILIIICGLFGVAQAQTIGYLRYDSVKMAKNGGTTELILENATKSVTGGVLVNTGNGRTQFTLTPALTGFWSTTGNAGTSSSNFLGTTDAQPLYFRTGNSKRLTINTNGAFGLGTGEDYGTAGYLLSTNGSSTAPTWVNPSAYTYTASNGLTMSSNNVKLGGTLVENTTIANAGFYTAITGTGFTGIGRIPTTILDVYRPSGAADITLASGDDEAHVIIDGNQQVDIRFSVDAGATHPAAIEFSDNLYMNSTYVDSIVSFNSHNGGHVIVGNPSAVTFDSAFNVRKGAWFQRGIRASGLTNLSTQDRLIGVLNSTGQLGTVTFGSGISLSSGVISATGSGGTVTGTGTSGQGAYWNGTSSITGGTGFLYNGSGTITVGTSFLAPVGSVSAASFGFTGNTNTGIYSPASNQVNVASGGALAANFNGNTLTLGQWGSGQTINAASGGAGNSNRAGINLTIGSGQSTGNGVGGNTIFQYTPAGGSGTSVNAYTTAMTILGTNGNVGIGTASPSAKLHIISTTEQLRSGYDVSNYWNATTASTGTTTIAATGSTGSFNYQNRLSGKQGADVASATNLVLGYDGNTFEVTGTTDIELISNLGWQNGSIIYLIFNESLTVINAVATDGTNVTIELAGAGNFSVSVNTILGLLLSERTDGVQAWREISRSVN